MTRLLTARAVVPEAAPDLIIDGRLAFREHGLVLALALARVRPVWLVPGLWALLQRFEVIDYPEFAEPGEDVEAMLPVLREWHAVWTGSTLLERFFWVGDVLFESRLPPEFDQGAARRLQDFAALLERFASNGAPISALTVCARDAAALAAVRAADAPVILTHAEDGRAKPRICALLEEAGVPCDPLDGAAAARLSRAALGIHPPAAVERALDCGIRVAALSILAPRAVAAALEPDEAFDADDTVYAEEQDPWRGARAVWCEVAP